MMTSYTPVEIPYDVVEYDSSLSPIILIHGGTMWRKTWDKISKVLCDQTYRKVYAPDMRNHGDCVWTDDFSFNAMSKDIIHFMDKQSIVKAILIGHSMGGNIASRVAASHPHRVEKLVIEDSSPRPLSAEMQKQICGTIEALKKSLELIPPDVDMPTAQKIIKDNLAQRTGATKDDGCPLPLQKEDGHYIWKTNLSILMKLVLHFQQDKSLEGCYQNPALFIYGTKSPFNIFKDKELILKTFPNTKFHAIEGASHLVHTEFPTEFSKAVAQFVNDS